MHQERKIVFRVSTAKKVVMIEGVVIGILRIANTSRKINAKWERIVHSFTRKRRSDLPLLHEKKQGKQNDPIMERHRLQL